MSWDPAWERVFLTQEWGKYPPEALIRFVARNYYRVPDRKKVRICEVGCGTGANAWYMAREGFDVCGVDGAPTAILRASQRMRDENLTADLRVGDIARLEGIFEPRSFDAVVDVCCIQHNRLTAIDDMLKQIETVLKPGGRFFGMMLAAGSCGDNLGRLIEPGTLTDITEGPLNGKGLTHFFTIDEIQRLFGRFVEVKIESMQVSFDNRAAFNKHWIVEAQKADA